jgi:hypothetical protein
MSNELGEQSPKRKAGIGKQAGSSSRMSVGSRLARSATSNIDHTPDHKAERRAKAATSDPLRAALQRAAENARPEAIKRQYEASNGRLPLELRRYIVELNACRFTPSQVVKQVEAFCGVRLTLQKVQCYDPTKKAGRGLSGELRELFISQRRAYDRDFYNAHSNSEAWRANGLTAVIEQAMKQGNLELALDGLAMAEKLAGNRPKKAGVRGRPDPIAELVARLNPAQRLAILHRLVLVAREHAPPGTVIRDLPGLSGLVLPPLSASSAEDAESSDGTVAT